MNVNGIKSLIQEVIPYLFSMVQQVSETEKFYKIVLFSKLTIILLIFSNISKCLTFICEKYHCLEVLQ